MIYAGAGRIEDAQRVMADCLRMMPNWRRSTMPAIQNGSGGTSFKPIPKGDPFDLR